MESALERDAIASMHGGAPLAASSVLDAARAARIPISAASSGDEATFKAQSLSDDLRAVAREELKKGNVVIAPTGETTVGNTSGTAAFYSIDPRTGVTTSLGADGTHPSQEYVFQAAATLAFVGTVGFGLCGAFATADRISRCCWAFSVLSGAVLTLLVLPETLPILRGAGGATTATGAGVSGVMCMPDLPGTSPDQRRDREDRERRTGCAYPPRWC